MELTGLSLAAREAGECDWNDDRLDGDNKGWGPGSNGWLGTRRTTLKPAALWKPRLMSRQGPLVNR